MNEANLHALMQTMAPAAGWNPDAHRKDAPAKTGMIHDEGEPSSLVGDDVDLSELEANPFHEATSPIGRAVPRVVLAEPEPERWLIDAADLLAEPDPGPTPWLVQDLIVDQALVACVGRWKTTKSYGLLDLCISVATGRPAFGTLTVPESGVVVFVNEESGRRALWRRLDALCRGRATSPEKLRDRLFVAANARVKLDDPYWQNELLDLGRDLAPRLFVFDPLARMKGARRNENAQEEMAEVIEFWRHLRDQTGAAVAVVHHTGHEGNHMRGSSDLESVWETRLSWKRDDQAPVVTVESEHREAEGCGPIQYRIGWDGDTRTMRFELEEDDLTLAVRAYLRDHPGASANEVAENVQGGKRQKKLALVKAIREGGSQDGEPPGNHPREAPPEGGSATTPHTPYGGVGVGNHPEEPGTPDQEPPEEQAVLDALEDLAS